METYHIKKHADYDALMIKLKTEGSTWNSDSSTPRDEIIEYKAEEKKC